MTRQYNINVYAPTLLIFKEHINKPADVIQKEAKDKTQDSHQHKGVPDGDEKVLRDRKKTNVSGRIEKRR
ncbi:hypothetical protein P7K49_015503 [Saguinus oedipus]|uniref:Uncharacterized protein n=1 Tax=Saguinus oedipus TaxID=9490 RepID=A0ABQ9V9G0_SAGOE|nr:hypothetical protein P7K49_015503 [Saguinus oedipus]